MTKTLQPSCHPFPRDTFKYSRDTPSLEDRIDQTAATWKWQRVIKATAVAVSFAMLVTLALGSFAVPGWISSPAVLMVGIALALFAAAVAWIVMIIGTVERRLDRKWLAAEVERDHQPLMDRFNAVLELDGRPHDVSAAMYRDAIVRPACRTNSQCRLARRVISANREASPSMTW